MNEEPTRREAEMQEQIFALTGRVMAQGLFIEQLLMLQVAPLSPEAQAEVMAVLRRMVSSETDARVQTDGAAVAVSDMVIHARTSGEALLARLERQIAVVRGSTS